jgi:diguanylate cyclase (GGDEF)-like protein
VIWITREAPKTVDCRGFETPGGAAPVRFTVSIGVATFAPGATVQQLIECADQALYAAKTGGRNQVQVGAPPGPPPGAAPAAAAG